MDTTRPNLLDTPPIGSSMADRMNQALAHLLLKREAFPVIPGAEKSTHPMWKDYGLVSSRNHRPEPTPTVVKVFTIEEVSWMEFNDTVAPNSDYYGFVGDVELSDGWTGRYSIEFELGEAIRYIQEFEKNQDQN